MGRPQDDQSRHARLASVGTKRSTLFLWLGLLALSGGYFLTLLLPSVVPPGWEGYMPLLMVSVLLMATVLLTIAYRKYDRENAPGLCLTLSLIHI